MIILITSLLKHKHFYLRITCFVSVDNRHSAKVIQEHLKSSPTGDVLLCLVTFEGLSNLTSQEGLSGR